MLAGRVEELGKIKYAGRGLSSRLGLYARRNSVRVVVYDFMSSIMQLEVKKRVGQESVRLLDDSNSDNDAENKAEKEEEKSYWSSLVNWGTKKPESTRTGDTIHVFSLAT
ncbi:hypothetical protein As57867_010667, partial [Aphanomyces stellatus]